MHSAATSIADHHPQSDTAKDCPKYQSRAHDAYFCRFTRGTLAALHMRALSAGEDDFTRDEFYRDLKSTLDAIQRTCIRSGRAGIVSRKDLEYHLTQKRWAGCRTARMRKSKLDRAIRELKGMDIAAEPRRGEIHLLYWNHDDNAYCPSQSQIDDILSTKRERKRCSQAEFRAKSGLTGCSEKNEKDKLNQALKTRVARLSKDKDKRVIRKFHAKTPVERVGKQSQRGRRRGQLPSSFEAKMLAYDSELREQLAADEAWLDEFHAQESANDAPCDDTPRINWAVYGMTPLNPATSRMPADSPPEHAHTASMTESLTPPCHTGPDAAPRQNDAQVTTKPRAPVLTDEFEQEHRSVVPAQNGDQHVGQNEQRDDPEEKTPSGVAVDKFEQGHAPEPSTEGTNPHPEGSEAWYTFEGEVMCRKLRARGDT